MAKAATTKFYNKLEMWDLKKLIPYDKNPRLHTGEQIEQICESIHEFGFTNPILVDSDNGIIAGHGRLEAAKKLRLKKVPVIVLDGLSDSQRRAYIIADNKLALNASWDDDLLAQELEALTEDGFDTSLIGFDENEIEEFLNMDVSTQIEAEMQTTGEDVLPEPKKEVIAKPGDIWELGRHRLMCGDACNLDHVNILMDGKKADVIFTDPPYGVRYSEKTEYLNKNLKAGNKVHKEIENDDKTPEEMKDFWYKAFSNMYVHSKSGMSYYMTCPPGSDLLLYFIDSLKNAGFQFRHILVWVKNTHVPGRCDYHYRHEPILYGWTKGSHSFYGGHTQTSVWDIKKPRVSLHHPTMKPVELVLKAIYNSSMKNEILLDVFGGSGTSLIACEKSGRRCFMMELTPGYTDLIIRRWENYTGKTAKRITS
jgi:DNA modification methylase